MDVKVFSVHLKYAEHVSEKKKQYIAKVSYRGNDVFGLNLFVAPALAR